MGKINIEKEIEIESKIKSKHLERWDFYMLAFFSMLFGLSASLLAQTYLIKNPDIVNEVFIGSLIFCLFIVGIIYLKLKIIEKKVKVSHNKIFELGINMLKGGKKK